MWKPPITYIWLKYILYGYWAVDQVFSFHFSPIICIGQCVKLANKTFCNYGITLASLYEALRMRIKIVIIRMNNNTLLLYIFLIVRLVTYVSNSKMVLTRRLIGPYNFVHNSMHNAIRTITKDHLKNHMTIFHKDKLLEAIELRG